MCRRFDPAPDHSILEPSFHPNDGFFLRYRKRYFVARPEPRHPGDPLWLDWTNGMRSLPTRRILQVTISWFAVFLVPSYFLVPNYAAADESKAPNILLIMADDLGWRDLHCQGNERLVTPALDELASEGVRFTNAYAAAPVCSPTRAALMTGKAPARLGINNHISGRDFVPDDAKWLPAPNVRHLDTSETTVAEELQAAGYRTGFFGKWHLAGVPGRAGLGIEEYYPEHQGFELNMGGCAHGGPPTFFDPYQIHNLAPRRKGEYLPDRLVDEVIQFIDGYQAAKPFFVTLWNYTVHWPMEAPADLVKKYEQRIGPGIKDARYAAMIEAMDRSYDRLFRFLDEKKLTDNTLVIFTSDNGAFGGVADSRPLRAAKGYLYEGGIRVPLIIRWPAEAKVGTVADNPVITMDLHATIRDAAGVETPSVDGRSLKPLLSGQEFKDRALYFHYPCYAWHRDNRLGSAIRDGDYKLIEWIGDKNVELYNVREDIGERVNLAEKQPDVARQLLRKLVDWRLDVKAAMPMPR